MWIGVPTEVKQAENRVALTAGAVRQLAHHGHHVLVQSGAGVGAGIGNDDYRAAGGQVVGSAEQVWGEAELIVKVKEPQPEEITLIRPGQALFTFLHLAPDPALTAALAASGCIAIAYETVTDSRAGCRCWRPCPRWRAGCRSRPGPPRWSVRTVGPGILLGGVPGTPPARVAVLGGGTVGSNAARMAAGDRGAGDGPRHRPRSTARPRPPVRTPDQHRLRQPRHHRAARARSGPGDRRRPRPGRRSAQADQPGRGRADAATARSSSTSRSIRAGARETSRPNDASRARPSSWTGSSTTASPTCPARWRGPRPSRSPTPPCRSSCAWPTPGSSPGAARRPAPARRASTSIAGVSPIPVWPPRAGQRPARPAGRLSRGVAGRLGRPGRPGRRRRADPARAAPGRPARSGCWAVADERWWLLVLVVVLSRLRRSFEVRAARPAPPVTLPRPPRWSPVRGARASSACSSCPSSDSSSGFLARRPGRRTVRACVTCAPPGGRPGAAIKGLGISIAVELTAVIDAHGRVGRVGPDSPSRSTQCAPTGVCDGPAGVDPLHPDRCTPDRSDPRNEPRHEPRAARKQRMDWVDIIKATSVVLVVAAARDPDARLRGGRHDHLRTSGTP